MINTMILILNRQLHSALLAKKQELEELPTHDLVHRYNRHAKTGFHVSAQAVEVACLHNIFMKRMGVSPVRIEDGCAVTLTGVAEYDGKSLKTDEGVQFIQPQNLN